MKMTQPTFDPNDLPSPCYVCDLGRLRQNLEILAAVRKRTGCRILLALKAFAMFSVFPLIRKYLQGTCASSIHEARLGREEFGGEVHVHAPAYAEKDMDELLQLADHISFNSMSQLQLHREKLQKSSRPVRSGLRINPQYSEVEVELYNPCAPGSRLGITAEELQGHDLAGISGLHFHTMCEQNADTLERTLLEVEKQFASYFASLEWINFGGGHHITRKDYNVDLLCSLINSFRERYGLEVYLEPGEAIALNAGTLISTVQDIIDRETPIAVLDTSAAAHMPDVLEMPYRPEVAGGGMPGSGAYTYRLAGNSCLAGDVIGEYSFAAPLFIGQRVVFLDMLHYTMVKNNTFNGVHLPAIATYDPETGVVQVIREFGYQDYRTRLS
ncbi:MAG: carboxynorspermidine decarboxylase [Desulfobulbales bacterium]|nr:carboxynorspermidine decarboxylase [Desulfobulbales bacterium]